MIGGRTGTTKFQFQGRMALVGILTGQLTKEDAETIHRQAMVSTALTGQCIPYQRPNQTCDLSNRCSK